jgi:hypothetical protein
MILGLALALAGTVVDHRLSAMFSRRGFAWRVALIGRNFM